MNSGCRLAPLYTTASVEVNMFDSADSHAMGYCIPVSLLTVACVSDSGETTVSVLNWSDTHNFIYLTNLSLHLFSGLAFVCGEG